VGAIAAFCMKINKNQKINVINENTIILFILLEIDLKLRKEQQVKNKTP